MSEYKYLDDESLKFFMNNNGNLKHHFCEFISPWPVENEINALRTLIAPEDIATVQDDWAGSILCCLITPKNGKPFHVRGSYEEVVRQIAEKLLKKN